MEESNVQLARSGFAAAARGDFALIAELLAPDVKWHGGDPDAPGACSSRTQALGFMRGIAARGGGSFPALVDVVGVGERVVVVMQPEGSGSRTANLATFSDGKVVEMVQYPDADEALRAIGC